MVPSFLKEVNHKNWLIQPLSYLISKKYVVGHLDGNHGSLYPRSNEFIDSGVKYISANALINGRVDFDKAKYLSHERASKFKKGVAKSGDVLFAHNATVGPVAILDTDDDYVILGTSLTYYRCNLEKLSNHYLLHFMNSPSFIRQYERIMKQTTRSQIPITAQREFYFVLPPLTEQQKIAEILTTWDKAINTTERLIENSKQQKKALMQQLLTGQKRLLDDSGQRFSGDWEEVSVGNVTKSIVPGRNKPKIFEGGIPWVTTPEIKGRYIPSELQKNYVSVNTIKECGAKIVPEGAVIIAAVGNLGLTAINKKPIVLNQQLHAFICDDNLDNEFLAYYLSTQKHYMESIASQTTIPYMNKTNCESIPILVPLLEEQQKIAAVLNNADKEIEVLEQQLADLQQEKKALMQQLLTGKKRVLVD